MTVTDVRSAQDSPNDDAPETIPDEPMVRVIRGTPTAEELAALTAVVVALSMDSPEPETTTTQRTWSRRNLLRLAPQPGPGSWRRSGR
ncbi:acyl-CoA carboxylase subunit epsilon [Arthrobacter sp. H20]|uniref:acyl-CoA carboxylase subunit epsilon n=1 Tax=Arthrobacter sp. H20 TaxID=1267981 RepID=UPI0004B0A4B3|nr:acyl-CoA carboxylase subunit epsilon [Arthrobacter sp. H20]